MAQIFISHSSKDRQSVDFLSKAFASTKVKGVFEEFEAILKGPANAERIAQDIRESNAVFVLLGLNVEALRHTRDWVGWENGFAAAEARKTNKDIWVLEPISEMDGLTVVIPYLRHYVCFNPTDEHWQGYLTQIIESYDDSHFLKAALVGGVGGGVGAGLASSGKGKDGKVGIGSLVGVGLGFLFAAFNSPRRPEGLPICCPKCWSVYSVHLAELRMRCPVCNEWLAFPDR